MFRGWHERVARYDHNFFSKSDAGTPFLMVDVNEFYIDGTPNPYFLRPYLGASQPRIGWRSEENDNYRATLAESSMVAVAGCGKSGPTAPWENV